MPDRTVGENGVDCWPDRLNDHVFWTRDSDGIAPSDEQPTHVAFPKDEAEALVAVAYWLDEHQACVLPDTQAYTLSELHLARQRLDAARKEGDS